jgi:hypothetical protein
MQPGSIDTVEPHLLFRQPEITRSACGVGLGGAKVRFMTLGTA